MSSPNPHADPENTHPSRKFKKKATTKTLKAMINRPASKDWFKKFGNPQEKYNKARTKALNKMK